MSRKIFQSTRIFLYEDFSLVKTFKSIHKDRESPKLNSTYSFIQPKLFQSYAKMSLSLWMWAYHAQTKSINPIRIFILTTLTFFLSSQEISISSPNNSKRSWCANRASQVKNKQTESLKPRATKSSKQTTKQSKLTLTYQLSPITTTCIIFGAKLWTNDSHRNYM